MRPSSCATSPRRPRSGPHVDEIREVRVEDPVGARSAIWLEGRREQRRDLSQLVATCGPDRNRLIHPGPGREGVRTPLSRSRVSKPSIVPHQADTHEHGAHRRDPDRETERRRPPSEAVVRRRDTRDRREDRRGHQPNGLRWPCGSPGRGPAPRPHPRGREPSRPQRGRHERERDRHEKCRDGRAAGEWPNQLTHVAPPSPSAV